MAVIVCGTGGHKLAGIHLGCQQQPSAGNNTWILYQSTVKCFSWLCFLGERLNKAQLLAVTLAATAVVIQTIMLGTVPWIALTVAASFGTYGLVRKMTAVAAVPGLAFETLFLLPIALLYFAVIYQSGNYHFRMDDLSTSALLSLAGFVTTFPLICFNMAAKKLPLSTIGLMQYLVPSMSFLIGVFLFKEPFTSAQLICFGLIWVALVIFTTDSLRQHRKTERQLTGKKNTPAASTPSESIKESAS